MGIKLSRLLLFLLAAALAVGAALLLPDWLSTSEPLRGLGGW